MFTALCSEVREFTRGFALPEDLHPRPEAALPPDRKAFIVQMIEDELAEFEAAPTLEEQIDALVDLVYYIGDFGVRMSLDLDVFLRRFAEEPVKLFPVIPAGPLPEKVVAEFIETLKSPIGRLRAATIVTLEEGYLVEIVYTTLLFSFKHGLPFERAFDIVHAANLRKLVRDAEGNVLRETEGPRKGKVLKPANWVGPDAEMAALIADARANATPPSLTLTLDGDEWCALFGPNLVQGVAGFGPTPNEAIYQFCVAYLGGSEREDEQ